MPQLQLHVILITRHKINRHITKNYYVAHYSRNAISVNLRHVLYMSGLSQDIRIGNRSSNAMSISPRFINKKYCIVSSVYVNNDVQCKQSVFVL